MCSLAFLVVSACTLIGGLSVCCPQRRYHVVRDVMTWDQARQHCQSNFTDLVSVPSEEEMLAVKALISRVSDYMFWLGLRRNTVSSPWEWSTGVAFQYSKWLSLEPDANGECGAMIPTGEWGAEPCANLHSFVCLAEGVLPGSHSEECGRAREHCRSLYTDLVSITSQDVLLDIEQLMNKDTSNTDYWIGLRRDGGSWGWGNGETFSYSNWGETWSTSDCVTIKTSYWNFGAWQVNNCNDNKKFICYKGKSLLSYRGALDQLPAQNV
ncbi:secretory phospholipase A2 receptor-like [Acipenser ruthenus]|uniref:secretory phospholipase A2 receptor-like n=1 Tax=Acipenser ruthenus TaxID=7906 RepID=UPI002740B15A|nr:secretory phospholipase A2 receptor-like [Acipenser ruthenus]